MDKVIVIALLIAVVIYFQYKESDFVPVTPLFTESYVVVYGREACGNTKYMESALTNADVSFYFGDFDDPKVKKEIYDRMDMAGYDTDDNFILPVVDVNGVIMVNPNIEVILAKYRMEKQ